VLLSALMLGKRCASLPSLIYIILGSSGLSIFSGANAGWMYLAGPTAGYLFGFIAASFIISNLSRLPKMNLVGIFLTLSFGSLVILIFGAAWLMVGFNYSAKNALLLGILPFLGGDIIKSSLAAVIYSRIKIIKSH
jgi:biotin transport system substrate-specific component